MKKSYDELQRENAKLTRKLAEQQTLVKKLHGYAPASWLDDCSGAGFEELTKLLAEAKSNALPDMRRLEHDLVTIVARILHSFDGGAHRTATECMDGWILKLRIDPVFRARVDLLVQKSIEAMLAAAPQPGGSNE